MFGVLLIVDDNFSATSENQNQAQDQKNATQDKAQKC